MDCLDLFAVQRTLKSLLQHHSSKASILQHSAFFTVQLLHPYMTTGKTIALTRWTFVGKVMSLPLNVLSWLVITFLPRSKCLLISWLQSPSSGFRAPQNKVWHCFHCFSIYLPWSTLATSCKELTHWKRPWCWEGLGAEGEGDDRGWDGWMASLSQWTWVWVDSGRWWWTGRPGMLWFMRLQRIGHDWVTELNWTEPKKKKKEKKMSWGCLFLSIPCNLFVQFGAISTLRLWQNLSVTLKGPDN